jgi:hypothetical protein
MSKFKAPDATQLESMRKSFAAPDTAQLEALRAEQAESSIEPIAEAPGYLETLAHQIPQGASFGLSDEIKGAIADPTGAYKTVANLLGAEYSPQETEEYQKIRDEERAALAATQEANPKTAILGQLVGGLLPGGAVAKGVGMLAGAPLTGVQTAARAGALEGTLYGAGQSEGDKASDIAKEAVIGTALGGTLGAATGQLGRFLGGNKADIASGALPADTKESIGLIKDLGQSKLGRRIKGFYEAGQNDVDLSSEAAELARGKNIKEEAAKIIDTSAEKSREVGRQIGEKVKKAGPFKPESTEEVLQQLPREVQEEVVKVIPGKARTISEAPEVLQNELSKTEKSIQDIIQANPTEATKNFQKVSSEMVNPAILDGEIQYSQLGQAQAARIKEALQKNPEQTLSDLYNNIVKGEAPSIELDDLFQQLKFKTAVEKLAKEAQVTAGQVPPEIQTLQNLLNKKSALKKAVAEFGKKTIAEPDTTVKEIVTKLDDSHLLESDKVPARKLKDIISKYVQKDGTVLPEKTAEFRNSLQSFQKSTDNYEIGSLAKKLESEIVNFRKQAAGNLSEEFHDLKSFAEMLKVDISGMSKNEIKNQLAPRFGKFLAKSESTANLDTGMAQDLVDKFVEANGNDPIIAESLKKIAKDAQWSELHKVKSGSTGSMFNDGVNRLLFAFPLETAGQISSNPLVKTVVSTTATTSSKLLAMPSAAWRAVAAKTSSISPTMSKMASTMADTTDMGKKRAILNSLNQMPSFRKAIENMYGSSEEE